MRRVSFETRFDKLNNVGSNAVLMYAGLVDFSVTGTEEVFKDLLTYNYSKDGKCERSVTNSQYLLLIFRDTETNTVFTKLEMYCENNINKYLRHMGETFEVTIRDEVKD